MAPGVTQKSGDSAQESSEPQEWRPIRPNMVITGTPGVGKTSFSTELARELGLRHIEVGVFARERNLLADHDPLRNAFYMHEDAVLDELEPLMTDGGIILDHHSCDWYPERWIQMVICLRASTEALYDRLEQRGYSSHKLNENMEAEIMQVVFEEAVNSYPNIPVLQLQNDNEEQKRRNINEVKRLWRSLVRRFENHGENLISDTGAGVDGSVS
ncbi:Adenylate kinase isoenzyme 6 [Gracilariopsis chorda]|uniref:Adenylate kinase isoenzyme 6 homolog n=1 Tax=Gracilariopsis chorda TaxID=448386 RepID=A0A2V3J2J9_9FLOR|nr:Adenylate kinase isoenzyme 6 [Gracilariopsis chorda]|eukprot:PXF48671.1 Adenylate kinase isoenzyme 6 [Gracilariopsis chorda]